MTAASSSTFPIESPCMAPAAAERIARPISARMVAVCAFALLCAACAPARLVSHFAMPVLDGGAAAMERESDLALAEAAIPAQLKLLEGMIVADPGAARLREYAAQAIYGYTYGFVEDADPARAAALYARCAREGATALRLRGLAVPLFDGRAQDIETAVDELERDALGALFWTGSCLAKSVDMQRNDPAAIVLLPKAVALMQRVLELDETYYHGGAHLFFGVYLGGLAPMFGGDAARAERHFARAREISSGRLLLADLLRAQYLERQRQDRAAFRRLLLAVRAAPADLMPEMALSNAIAQRKAAALLAQESEWF